ncbi:hypothetical protein H8D79_00920 [PVC group bacterium]|nr:hypothetical protein [PVC group bacterium]
MSSIHRYILAVTVSLLCAVLLVAPAAARDDGLVEAALADGAVTDDMMDSGIAPGGRDIEETIWFQGFLADVDTGDPINGTVNITAEIFDAATVGISLWGAETHNSVPVVEGWFNIELGSVVTLPGFDDPPYYLELTVSGETMDPRQKLASVPMAYHAATLDLPFEGTVSASTGAAFRVNQEGSSAGIGVFHTGLGSNSALYARHYGLGAAISGYGHDSGSAIKGEALSTGLAGDFIGDVDVDGDLETDGFTLTASPSAGHVLTSDAGGVGTWQAPSGGLTLPYSGTYSGSADALAVTQSGANAYEAAEFTITNTGSSGNAIYAYSIGTSSVIQGYHSGGSGSVADLDIASGSNSSPVVDARTTGEGPAYYGDTDGLYAVEVYSSYESGDTHVVHSEFTATGNYDATAVYGYSAPADYYGFGGLFEGGYTGVYGEVNPTGNDHYYGVDGEVWGGSGYNYGVYGSASGGATNWAGYFVGNVRVTGTIDNSLARSVIDHPLDPANKYLYHSSVESPDMMNVYNGNVILDASGEAWVELPEWFEALNRDFRYQLTAIGGFAPVYVADKVSGNRFRIAGGDPGMEISWQVTGIRQDNYAEENRIQVEEEKPESERGRYLHPEAYGLPRTMSVDYNERKEQRRQQVQENASARPVRPETEQAGPDDD